jgi:pimeloyl-ACP methyl ester carboxylesterase
VRRGDDGRLRFKHDPLHATLGPYGFRLEVAERFWRAVRCPVLLVEGAQSLLRLDPATAEKRYGCFADHRRAELAGAGHMMQRHQPDALARLLVEFLSPA